MCKIIGLTGPFGSGCTYIADEIFSKIYGAKKISLSSLLKEIYCKKDKSYSKEELQNIGDKCRREKGNNFLAIEAMKRIKEDKKNSLFIVDGIRNIKEVEELKKEGEFYLFAIIADTDVRWNRVKEGYRKDQKQFEIDEERDRDGKISNGQQVSSCYKMADVIIDNTNSIEIKGTGNNFRVLKAKIDRFMNVIAKQETFTPFDKEACMVMAYANSLRSLCKKRRVGAIIIDKRGNVISSGYNEVPSTEKPCIEEYGACYRDYKKSRYKEKLDNIVPNGNEEQYKLFTKTAKMLDYCRALHAEENSIINLTRQGTKIDDNSTIFSTTFPCNLCANKIAEIGIKKVVFFEPYPMEEAKKILKNAGVELIPFEGATHKGYFRFMEDNK